MDRQAEVDKYIGVYERMPDYRMGEARKQDALMDLRWARTKDCHSYLDIGCGRGEMLDLAAQIGYTFVRGVEAVPALCDPPRIRQARVDQLALFESSSFCMVTSFDVIEHLHPGDDRLLIGELGRIASRCLALTANNRPSVDPHTGADLHINKREYDEWDQIIRDELGEGLWNIERVADKVYVSETWRAWRV